MLDFLEEFDVESDTIINQDSILGTIGFENLKITCIIGIYREERDVEQDIFVDLRVKTELTSCYQTNDVAETVDYVKLADMCTKLAKENNYYLLESYCVDVLDGVFSHFSAQEAWIRVKKPKALPGADYAFVELSKEKP